MGFADATSLRPVNPFKVGDIVTATEGNPYFITDKDMTKGEVIEVYGGRITVKVLEHRTKPHEIGETYGVNSKYFELVTTTVASLKEGDIITGTKESDERYGITNTSMIRGEVIEVRADDIRIKVLEHKEEDAEYEGETFFVDPKYFEKVDIAKFKVEDIVEEADFAKLKAGDKVAALQDGEVFTLKERKPDMDGIHGAAWTTEEYTFGWIGEEQVKLVEVVTEEESLEEALVKAMLEAVQSVLREKGLVK